MARNGSIAVLLMNLLDVLVQVNSLHLRLTATNLSQMVSLDDQNKMVLDACDVEITGHKREKSYSP